MDTKNYIPIFRKILYYDMAPWLHDNRHDEKFTDKIIAVKSVNPEFSPQFSFDFPYRPYTPKAVYYRNLILSETNDLCNLVYNLIEYENDLNLKKYWKYFILDKSMIGWMTDLGHILKEKQYALDYINPRKCSFNIDEQHKTETYIMQLL